MGLEKAENKLNGLGCVERLDIFWVELIRLLVTDTLEEEMQNNK